MSPQHWIDRLRRRQLKQQYLDELFDTNLHMDSVQADEEDDADAVGGEAGVLEYDGLLMSGLRRPIHNVQLCTAAQHTSHLPGAILAQPCLPASVCCRRPPAVACSRHRVTTAPCWPLATAAPCSLQATAVLFSPQATAAPCSPRATAAPCSPRATVAGTCWAITELSSGWPSPLIHLVFMLSLIQGVDGVANLKA